MHKLSREVCEANLAKKGYPPHEIDIWLAGYDFIQADLATANATIERLERILKSACIEVVEDGHQFNPKAVKHYCGEITAQRIEALEGKLAAAERSNEWLRHCISDIRAYALDAKHWAIGNACDDALATGVGSLQDLDALQKENTDAK